MNPELLTPLVFLHLIFPTTINYVTTSTLRFILIFLSHGANVVGQIELTHIFVSFYDGCN